jgi:hypothetical protein
MSNCSPWQPIKLKHLRLSEEAILVANRSSIATDHPYHVSSLSLQHQSQVVYLLLSLCGIIAILKLIKEPIIDF